MLKVTVTLTDEEVQSLKDYFHHWVLIEGSCSSTWDEALLLKLSVNADEAKKKGTFQANLAFPNNRIAKDYAGKTDEELILIEKNLQSWNDTDISPIQMNLLKLVNQELIRRDLY